MQDTLHRQRITFCLINAVSGIAFTTPVNRILGLPMFTLNSSDRHTLLSHTTTTTLFTMFLSKKTQEASSLKSSQVEEVLKKAKPAKRPDVPCDHLNAGAGEPGYLHLNYHETKDNVWACCCGIRNSLEHLKSDFSFKPLVCGSCTHVLRERYGTTEITTDQLDAEFMVQKDETRLRFSQEP